MNDPTAFNLSSEEISAMAEAASESATSTATNANASGNGHSPDLNTRLLLTAEKTVLGTLLLINADTALPVAIAQLLNNAPDSFYDQRHKQISTIIRALKDGAKPVYPQAVIERCEFEDAAAYVDEMVKSALSLDLANREAEPIWQAYRERRTTTVFVEAFNAVANAPAMSRSIAINVRTALAQLEDEAVKDELPEIQDAANLLPYEPVLPPLLIDGLLHQGSKLSLGGSSKAYKSWTLINIAASLATGADFMGMETTRCKVLYVNFEIAPCFMHQRLNMLLTSRLLFPEPGWLDVWNLRGYSAPYSVIIPKIIKRARDKGYGLIIIDPSYKLFDANADENSAVDVANIMNAFDTITTQTAAAVAFGAHFAKGNAAAKEAIDRVSGSGVFARDPDSCLTFTKHKEEDCFTVEASLRNLPPLAPFVVRWEYPRFQRDESLNPAQLKQAGGGRPDEYDSSTIVDFLRVAPMTTAEWKKICMDELGMSRASFFRIQKEVKEKNLAFRSPSSGKWSPALQSPDKPD